jgi:TRAP-type uncharacterized transport system substrate-binding protein
MSNRPVRWGEPIATRSRIALEIACHMVSAPDQPYRQAKVLLREQGSTKGPQWPVALFGSSTVEGINEVVSGQANLAIINPGAMLTLAYKGTGQFKTPQPVRTISVIPTADQYVFAVNANSGLRCVEEILEKRYPLKVALRGQPDHCLHAMLDDILAAAGFSLSEVLSWGGEARREGIIPYPDGAKFAAFRAGEINAIFDEGAHSWVGEAIEAGMSILPLREATVRKLEAMGYRRSYLRKRDYPRLPEDVLTIDFSGWPIFVHAEASDKLITQICAGLDARKHLIPWEGEGPLPVERMCRDAEDTPIDVPLHPAAERFWRAQGYLP